MKDKEIKYLKRNNKDKKDIEPNENIYIIKEDEETIEEIIYTEIVYEIEEYKEYKKKLYIKNEDIPKNEENQNITYLKKYDKNKENIEEEKIIYIILEYEEKIEVISNELIKEKEIKYQKTNNKDKKKNKQKEKK